MSKSIHYMPEYGPDGLVARLYWSPAIQAAGDARRAEREAKYAEDERKRKQVMPAMREWAAKHLPPKP